MANEPAISFEDKMRSLRQSYLQLLGKRIPLLAQLAEQARQGPLPAGAQESLRQLAHQCAGTGTTYGYPDISSAGQLLEEMLLDIVPPSPTEVHPAIERLLAACQAAQPAGEAPRPAVAAPDPAPVASTGGKPTLLVIDDDPSVHRLLESLLAAEARLLFAHDGAEAEGQLASQPVDLILLDDQMPGTSGLQILEGWQKTGSPASNLPVIMLTASQSPDQVMRAVLAGAVDYIIKPFDSTGLVAKIGARLRRLSKPVLIADDDIAIRELLAHKFRAAGCRVILAQDGEEAWRQLQLQNIGLLMLDRMMPGMDGVTLLNRMKEHPRLADIPTIFLTTRHYGSDVLEGLNHGAVDYITKPFNPDEVVTRALRWIDKAAGKES